MQIGLVREVLFGRSLLVTLALVATVFALSGFIATTSDPNKVEVATSDVAHFYQAFDDASKLPMAEQAGIYRKEYFDHGSQGLKDYAAFRHVTPETLAEHVEQNRAYYARIRLYINQVVDQKLVIQAAFHRLKALYPGIRFPAHVYFVVGPQKGAGMNSDNGIILAADCSPRHPARPTAIPRSPPSTCPSQRCMRPSISIRSTR